MNENNMYKINESYFLGKRIEMIWRHKESFY